MDSPAMKAALAVSKAFLFLFTSKAGLIATVIVAALLASLRLAAAARSRILIERAAGKKGGFSAGAQAIGSELASGIAWGASNIPTLITALAALALMLGLSGIVTRFDEYLGLQQKVREYSIVLKNLERRAKVARVECLSRSGGSGRYAIEYFSADDPSAPKGREEIEMAGREIYFDAIALNFAYSGIESGEVRNLALPYRIFSDQVSQSMGRRLAVLDEKGTPYFFARAEDQLYGVSKEVFDARLAEIVDIFQSEAGARKAGVVRSLYGNAVHRPLDKGQAFTVWIEQSGGLTIKEERDF